MRPEVDKEAIRITQQFRSGVYDLRGSAGRLTLRVTGRGGDDGPPREWRIEASTGSSPDAVVVAERGATRAEALRAVGRSWNEKRLSSNLAAAQAAIAGMNGSTPRRARAACQLRVNEAEERQGGGCRSAARSLTSACLASSRPWPYGG
jgi:hypothetical protein